MFIWGAFFWGYSSYSYSSLGITEYTEFQFRKERSLIWNGIPMAEVTWELLCLPGAIGQSGRVGFSAKKIPKRTRILSIPSKPYSFHSVHFAVKSRMNGMIFRSFQKRNSAQKNTNTVSSKYPYSGIVPKERAHNKDNKKINGNSRGFHRVALSSNVFLEGEKNPRSRDENQQQTQPAYCMVSTPGIEPWPHWWKAGAPVLPVLIKCISIIAVLLNYKKIAILVRSKANL